MKIEDFLKNTYFDEYLDTVVEYVTNIIKVTGDTKLDTASKKLFDRASVLDIEFYKDEYFVLHKNFMVDIIAKDYWYRFNSHNDLATAYNTIERSSSGTRKQNQDYRDTVSSSLNMYETFCGTKTLPEYQKKLVKEAISVIKQGIAQGNIPEFDFDLLENRIFYITKTMLDNYVFIGPLNSVLEIKRTNGLYQLYEIGIALNRTDALDTVKHIFEQDKKIAATSKTLNNSLDKIVKSLKKDKDNDK